MQGTWVPPPAQEDPMLGETKARAPRLLRLCAAPTEAGVPRACALQREELPLTATRESPWAAAKTQHHQN